jgi:DNA-binding transcriptional MocR family regulator
MSAAALFTPGAGSFHTPHSQRLNVLPPKLRVAASETWHAILDLLRRGQTETDERITDRVLSQHMGRSRRFVQKGLKALQDLGMIRRRRQFGRRVIIVLERLRGRPKPQPKPRAADAKPAAAKPPSVPNVGVIPPASPEHIAAAKAANDAIRAGDYREPTAEEKAEAQRFLEESRRRRQAAERAKERPKVVIAPAPGNPGTPGLTAQAVLDARRKAMGIRVAPDPDPDHGPGSPALPAGP